MSLRAQITPEEWGYDVLIFFRNGKMKDHRQFLFSRFASSDECLAAAQAFEHEVFVRACAPRAQRKAKRAIAVLSI